MLSHQLIKLKQISLQLLYYLLVKVGFHQVDIKMRFHRDYIIVKFQVKNEIILMILYEQFLIAILKIHYLCIKELCIAQV